MIASLPVSERAKELARLAATNTEAVALLHDWSFWARPNQCSPQETDDWVIWLLLSGRGWGKTRTGAEWIYDRWRRGKAQRIALIANTPADARDVMIEGESGIMSVGYPHERPAYEPSKRRLTWPNGALATIFSAYEPDQLRGPQHDTAWGDEIAVWKYARETHDNLMLGLRLGDPRCLYTTTPKPIALLRELVRRKDVKLTTGTTYENVANLSPHFMREVVARYEGTTLGQQELHAALLEEAEGALWKRNLIRRIEHPPELVRIVVAIDPAVSATEESNETGIIVAGRGKDGHAYVLSDVSGRYGPDAWGRAAVHAYDQHQADRIVYEANQGGDLVAHTLETVRRNLPLQPVHATVSKRARAEPVAALYEQGKVLHVGVFEELEDQLCTWEPLSGDNSPDRLDALVWALTALMITDTPVLHLDPDEFAARTPSYWRGH